jgi:hypothetical protein
VLTPQTLRNVFGVNAQVVQAPERGGLIIVPLSRA